MTTKTQIVDRAKEIFDELDSQPQSSPKRLVKDLRSCFAELRQQNSTLQRELDQERAEAIRLQNELTATRSALRDATLKLETLEAANAQLYRDLATEANVTIAGVQKVLERIYRCYEKEGHNPVASAQLTLFWVHRCYIDYCRKKLDSPLDPFWELLSNVVVTISRRFGGNQLFIYKEFVETLRRHCPYVAFEARSWSISASPTQRFESTLQIEETDPGATTSS